MISVDLHVRHADPSLTYRRSTGQTLRPTIMALLDPLYNKPNRVPEMQRYFQQPTKHFIFSRTPKDRLCLAVYATLSAGGLIYALWGLGEMTVGVGKKPGY